MSVTRPAPTTNLFLVEELRDSDRTSDLSQRELDALQTVGTWIEAIIVEPHADLGRAGPVCPFVPVSLEHKTLWLAPEHAAGRSPAAVVELVRGYQRRFLDAHPTDGNDAVYKAIVVVFTDLSPNSAGAFFDDVLKELAVPSY